MKKIPGTLYHLGITSARDGNLNIDIWYRNQLVFERKYLSEIFSKRILVFKESDDLPFLSDKTLDYFLFHWINVKYEGPLILFNNIEKHKDTKTKVRWPLLYRLMTVQ